MKRRNRNARQGTAAVEFAVILPVFVLLVLGTIEATSMIFLKQSLTIAAYEGARIALVPGSNLGNVEGAIHQILEDRNVKGAETTVWPIKFWKPKPGELVTVTVEASCDENSLFSPWFYAGRKMSVDVTVAPERI